MGNNPRNGSNQFVTTMATFAKTGSGGNYNSNSYSFYPCLFCDAKGTSGHLMKNCPVVTNADKRWDIFRKNSRCTACCSPLHRYRDCPSEKTCWCGKKHHVSLHSWFDRIRPNNRQQGLTERQPPRNQEQNQPAQGNEPGRQRPAQT